MLEHGAQGVCVVAPVAPAAFVEERPIRILIADDHEIVRLGLRAILEARPQWKVVAEAANGKEEKLVSALELGYRRGDSGALSTRERMIVQFIAEGHGNKEMAAILTLSVKTIESHRAAAMRKLNVGSTVEIVRYAVRNKLVEA